LDAVHPVVAAAKCGEQAAVHRVDGGLGAHLSFDSDGRQGVVAELAQGVNRRVSPSSAKIVTAVSSPMP
jgi:hypothetical protein